jgi:hypothetical protein
VSGEKTMTEEQWLSYTHPMPMLDFLRGKASGRKVRLFACGCCRHVWDHLNDDIRDAVEVTERLADGLAELSELGQIGLWEVLIIAMRHSFIVRSPWDGGRELALRTSGLGVSRRKERQFQAALLRCIYGNPFGPSPIIDSSWLSWNEGTIPGLAQAIYEDRAFDRLPILADALEEAGCTDPDILGHCRGQGEHVRGCWVVDLILGKQYEQPKQGLLRRQRDRLIQEDVLGTEEVLAAGFLDVR